MSEPNKTTKINKLTTLQTLALTETLTPDELEKVTVGRTTAEFTMTPAAAVSLVMAVKKRAWEQTGNGRAHPVGSLNGVIRKLRDAAFTTTPGGTHE